MRQQSDPKLPFQAAILYVALGAVWLSALVLWAPQNRAVQFASAALFVVISASVIYAIVRRGVAEQRLLFEELRGHEQRATRRQQRLDVL